MRKIEQDMLEAISTRKSWTGANTSVFIETCGNPFGTRAEVYLHGKHIATHWDGDGVVSDDPMYTGSREESTDVEVDTFRRWPTTTTRSRLRALGINASIKQGQACIDGVPV